MSKGEIERVLATKGVFIQIDYLKRFLREDLPIDTKKFAYLKLAELYEQSGMFIEAAKYISLIAENVITFKERRGLFIKEFKLLVKAGQYGRADVAIKKAYNESNTSEERREIKDEIKKTYLDQAKEYEIKGMKGRAISVYEKALHLDLEDFEKNSIKERLIPLYETTGKLREFYAMRKGKG